MNRFIRLFNTVKYLEPIQIRSRLYYALRGKWRKVSGFAYPLSLPSHSAVLVLVPSTPSPVSYEGNAFTFLNLSHAFKNRIDWNHAGYGKLWTYNLTYFDFLQQSEMEQETGRALIRDFIDQIETVKDGLEPFPISLRGINWIKFLTRHAIKEQTIDDSLYAQYHRLMDNLEYHLLGNHLLENGFSLLYGAYYFHDERFYTAAKKILISELEEQILADGAHFELSPMYHQIMLFRVLDCINLIQGNLWKDRELLPLLEAKAPMMIEWLQNITYADGTIPLFNDSANGIAPTTHQLTDYASTLLSTNHYPLPTILPLSQSGYRKIIKPRYECVIDVGNIGPDYIPGHAHSDTFNFEFHIDGKAFIVDTGLSTYETNAQRTTERSTAAHNTVMIDGREQSEVWGGFRVAERAKIVHLVDHGNTITATHDGYKNRGILHTRTWHFKDDKITIEDTLSQSANAVARLHFHPDVTEEEILNRINIQNSKFTIHHYSYAPEFNTTIQALVIEIPFTQNLTVEIAL